MISDESSGAKFPTKATDERVKAALDTFCAAHNRLPTLLELRAQLGVGSFDRLQRLRVAYAIKHGMADQVPRALAKAAGAPSTVLDRIRERLERVEALLKQQPRAMHNDQTPRQPDGQPMEALQKRIAEALRNQGLQTAQAVGEATTAIGRLAARLERLEQTLKPLTNWRVNLRSEVVDVLSQMGLRLVVAQPAEQLRKTRRPRRRRKPKSGRRQSRSRPSAARNGRPADAERRRPSGRRFHDHERLGFDRFVSGSAQRHRVLQEAAREIRSGDLSTGLALVRGCIKAAGGYSRAAKATRQTVAKLRSTFGVKGSPTTPETAAILGWLAKTA